MDVEEYDPWTGDESVIHFLHRARAAFMPGGEQEPVAYTLNTMRHRGKTHHEAHWVAREGDRVLAAFEATWLDAEDNKDRAWVALDVLPGSLDPEVVAALLKPALETLRGHGRTTLTVEVEEGAEFASYVRARGGTVGSIEQFNVTSLASLDEADLAALARVPDGYELVTFDGPCPDELIEPYVRMVTVMNTAPRDALTYEDWVHTPERIRDFESGFAARGHDLWTVCARRIGDEDFAAFTNVIVSPEWPAVIQQEDTAVAPPHRGHGLGFCVKATNLLRIVRERPETKYVSTWNAASNEHMLRVNHRLGFRCQTQVEAYEISADALEAQPA